MSLHNCPLSLTFYFLNYFWDHRKSVSLELVILALMLRLSPSSFAMCLLALVPPFPSSLSTTATLVTGPLLSWK